MGLHRKWLHAEFLSVLRGFKYRIIKLLSEQHKLGRCGVNKLKLKARTTGNNLFSALLQSTCAQTQLEL